MTVKTVASRFGNAILDAGTAMHNANLDTQITEKDEAIAAMQKQLARLEEERSDLASRKI